MIIEQDKIRISLALERIKKLETTKVKIYENTFLGSFEDRIEVVPLALVINVLVELMR